MASVTSRYARAFAEVVLDKRLERQKTEDELRSFVELLHSSPDLRTIWDNPSVEAAQKHKVLDAIVARTGTSPMVRNFIAVLIDHGRITALPEIAPQVEVELNQRLGIADAQVTTARQLGDPEKRALETRVGELTGKRVRARYATDPGVLGGAVVKVGSTIYDGSIRGQLERLKQELSGT